MLASRSVDYRKTKWSSKDLEYCIFVGEFKHAFEERQVQGVKVLTEAPENVRNLLDSRRISRRWYFLRKQEGVYPY
jgi:hypothetical protein